MFSSQACPTYFVKDFRPNLRVKSTGARIRFEQHACGVGGTENTHWAADLPIESPLGTEQPALITTPSCRWMSKS